jgi:hypothetical protein
MGLWLTIYFIYYQSDATLWLLKISNLLLNHIAQRGDILSVSSLILSQSKGGILVFHSRSFYNNISLSGLKSLPISVMLVNSGRSIMQCGGSLKQLGSSMLYSGTSLV